jgi:16S rRNA (guanine(527)-N(7))-methyltransferase RsmG
LATTPDRSGLHHLQRLQELFALQLSRAQQEQTLEYLQLLQKWNRAINLTSIEQVEPILRLHFFESFWVTEQLLRGSRSLADVGTGAGFPGLAAKLYRPRLQLTLIEKSYRKTVFLKEVCRALGLAATIVAASAETVANWAQVEVVAFRALQPSPALQRVLSESRCRLLILHGAGGSKPDSGLFALHQRLPVPGADQRFASLFLPLTPS